LDRFDVVILCAVYKSEPQSLKNVIEYTRLPAQTVFNHVEKLEREGYLTSKYKSFPRTRLISLTQKGMQFLLGDNELLEQIEAIKRAEVNVKVERLLESLEQQGLLDEIGRRLHAHGAALDIQKSRGFLDGLLVVPPIKDLVKSFLLLGEDEKKYLGLLAGLYVDSVQEILGGRPLTYLMCRCGWQLAWALKGPQACEKPVRKTGFSFNYPAALKKHEDDLQELHPLLTERRIDDKSIFFRLLMFSFPAGERRKIARAWREYRNRTGWPMPARCYPNNTAGGDDLAISRNGRGR